MLLRQVRSCARLQKNRLCSGVPIPDKSSDLLVNKTVEDSALWRQTAAEYFNKHHFWTVIRHVEVGLRADESDVAKEFWKNVESRYDTKYPIFFSEKCTNMWIRYLAVPFRYQLIFGYYTISKIVMLIATAIAFCLFTYSYARHLEKKGTIAVFFEAVFASIPYLTMSCFIGFIAGLFWPIAIPCALADVKKLARGQTLDDLRL